MIDIITSLLMILIPMLLGYLILVKQRRYLDIINYVVTFLLYAILFVLGFGLGQLDDLAQRLPVIGITAFTLAGVIIGCNVVTLMILDFIRPITINNTSNETLPSYGKLLGDSIKLCLVIVIGMVLGIILKNIISFPPNTSTAILITIIFFLAIQMRNSGIPLKSALVNKRGFLIALLFTLSSLIGGVIVSFILNLPLFQILALASGFGWYSLSSIMIADAWGMQWGSVAFLNDISREILSFFLIPLFMCRFSATAIGVAGATALDFTLPIIQKTGGMAVVPVAISFGIITNILPPILMVVFSSI